MPVYSCRVADARGRIGEFLREAASEESCLRELPPGMPTCWRSKSCRPWRCNAGDRAVHAACSRTSRACSR